MLSMSALSSDNKCAVRATVTGENLGLLVGGVNKKFPNNYTSQTWKENANVCGGFIELFA